MPDNPKYDKYIIEILERVISLGGNMKAMKEKLRGLKNFLLKIKEV